MAALLDMEDPGQVLAEVRHALGLAGLGAGSDRLLSAYDDILRLYEGHYPGYRACNTHYHDLKHTTDVFLASARLAHGYVRDGQRLGQRMAELTMISAMMHDTGYIQQASDTEGTGAKYTVTHVERSVEFTAAYGRERGWTEADIATCERLILATDIKLKLPDIPYVDEEELLGGRIMLIADLLGQMADRIYLEKLLFLYHEFKEAGFDMYASEEDLLRKTVGFYEFIKNRLITENKYDPRIMEFHFRERWGMHKDLYTLATEKNMGFLKKLIHDFPVNYRAMLTRGGVVQRLVDMGL
jgi:hypothetical protein